MIPLLIYGSGGHAREVLELVRCLNDERPRFEVVGWIDDDPAKQGVMLKEHPVLARGEALRRLPTGGQVVLALGSPSTRRRVAIILSEASVTSPVLVHPRAWVGRDVELGPGTQVAAGAMVSTDVRISRHAILNQGATVAHDVVLGDYATLAPGVRLSGAVTVGEGADVGTGSAVIQGVRIGAWSVVGAGAAVVRDVPDDATAVGVPARVIAARPAGWHELG
jgi:sugar O-acyltransferase (sialic acid O-acetyltransferase NeuD family)